MAIHCRFGGKYDIDLVANLLLTLTVKVFVRIMNEYQVAHFLWTLVFYALEIVIYALELVKHALDLVIYALCLVKRALELVKHALDLFNYSLDLVNNEEVYSPYMLLIAACTVA